MQDVPVATHVILMFDCCRGTASLEMSAPPPTAAGPSFQLTIRPSELSDLKNADLKNTYIFHATLPNQVSFRSNLLGLKIVQFIDYCSS